MHTYTVDVEWTGASETGTASYTSYSRDTEVRIGSKPVILGSADAHHRGDPGRVSPEELLVAAVAQCHMLWFLHVAAQSDVVVTGYEDSAVGTIRTEGAGTGEFTEIVLRPRVRISHGEGNDELVARLHRSAQDHCPVGRALHVPVLVRPVPVSLDHTRV